MPKSAKKPSSKGKSKVPRVQCVWALVCGSASVDQFSNQFSIFNIIEEINLPSQVFGAEPPASLLYPHEIIIMWRRAISANLDSEAFDYDVAIELIDPEGKSILTVFNKMTFLEGKERMRARIGINILSNLTKPGNYVYRIRYKTSDEEEFKTSDNYEIPLLVRDMGAASSSV